MPALILMAAPGGVDVGTLVPDQYPGQLNWTVHATCAPPLYSEKEPGAWKTKLQGYVMDPLWVMVPPPMISDV